VALTARLNSPLSLYRKLEREAYRAFHAATPLHKADHFFNFCVTAASMRDYTLEHLGKITQAEKQPYHSAWSQEPALIAAAEVANSAKHFILRDRSTGKPAALKTRAVRMRKAPFTDVFVNSTGDTKVVRTLQTEVHVTLSGGQVLDLYAFTDQVLKYWSGYLRSLGLKVRRQPFALLSGSDA
jgi:hypothetical protein